LLRRRVGLIASFLPTRVVHEFAKAEGREGRTIARQECVRASVAHICAR
jgi:hypothetical protein